MVAAATAFDHWRNSSRSSDGTPSSSAITITGSGTASPAISSNSLSPSTSASSSRAIASMRGRSPATRRGVKARFTMPRSRACEGGSEFSTVGVMPSGESRRRSSIAPASWLRACEVSEEKVSWSRSTARQSAWRVSTHACSVSL